METVGNARPEQIDANPGPHNQALRVAMFCASSSLYGCSRAALFSALAIRPLGSETAFVLDSGPLQQLIRDNGFPLLKSPNKYWLYSPGGWFKGHRRFTKNKAIAAKQAPELGSLHHPQIVHTHSLVSPLGAMLADRLGIPHVWHMHECPNTSEGDQFLLGLGHARRFIDRTTDIMVVNSEFTLSAAKAICPSSKLRLVYYGLLNEADKLESAPLRRDFSAKGRVKLILVGSIQKRKGQADAIGALAALARCGIDAELTLVGEGPRDYVDQLRAAAAATGVAERVTWAGFQDDPKGHYAEADIALVCSRGEPFGIVTVESMSMGIPTVGARSGGVTEVIEDGVNGMLYEVGDPESLAAKIKLLVENKELRDHVANAGYESVHARFGLSRFGRELRSIYGEAFENYRGRTTRT